MHDHGDHGGDKSCCRSSPARPWYRSKTAMSIAALAAVVALSFAVPLLEPFQRSLLGYMKMIWWAVLLGLVLGGVMDHFIPREHISHLLARRKKRTVLYAVLLGFLMSTCSHGILALAVELYKKGASAAGVVAFLLASPWANLPLTILLLTFFGLKALYFICGAMGIAFVTGLAFQFLESKDLVEHNPNSVPMEEGFSLLGDIRARLKNADFGMASMRAHIAGIWQGTVALSEMVLWWILLGMALASLAGAYIPQRIFHDYMGPTAAGLMVTLVLATVLEVCSEGTAPLAFELYRQTGAFGNVFVFLMAGVVTDYTEIGLIWLNIGRRAAIWLPIIAVPQVMVLGIIANRIF